MARHRNFSAFGPWIHTKTSWETQKPHQFNSHHMLGTKSQSWVNSRSWWSTKDSGHFIDWSEMGQACSASPVVEIGSLKEKPVVNSSLSEIIDTHKELFRDEYERICGSKVPNALLSRGGGSSGREQRYFSGWEKCRQRDQIIPRSAKLLCICSQSHSSVASSST